MSTDKKVVVVGAGLGGLSAAACLAADGFQVAIYEKNARIGGKLNLHQQDGYEFDLGPSIIILPQLFERVYERAGRKMADYVELIELQPQWRSFWEDGTVLDLHPDMARMEVELRKLGPAANGYWSYMEYSRKLWNFAEKAYMERGSDGIGDIVRGHGVGEVFEGTDLLSSMIAGIERHVREPHLRDMLGFFIKYVGSSCYDAPALMNLLPYSQMGFGLWYVVGGMYNMARGYDKLLGELGVEIHLESEVTRIRKEGDRVRGITLADGTEVDADAVVSNMEVIPVYRDLMDEGGLFLKKYELLYEPAASGLVVHLGVDRTYDQLEHHNFFFARDLEGFLHQIHRRKELPDDPTIYLVCPTKTNKDIAPEGCDIIKILPHIPYIQDPPYTAEDYAALKERVYDKLERMGLTDLRKHIVTEHVLVPDDLQRMYRSNKGAIYGVVSNRKRNFALKAPKQSARYRNLFFVGGSVNPGGGTPMVTLCGQGVADRVGDYLRR